MKRQRDWSMFTRRRFSQSLAVLAGGLCYQSLRPVYAQSARLSWRMPDEGEAHARTWMAFGASKAIWGSKLLPVVQRNLATIAKTIARYEPVTMLVRQSDYVVVLEGPQTIRKIHESDDFAVGYINFYVCNGAVIAPEFGDAKADGATKAKLQSLFPDREVVQLNIDGIAAGGGGIHCTTQQEPQS